MCHAPDFTSLTVPMDGCHTGMESTYQLWGVCVCVCVCHRECVTSRKPGCGGKVRRVTMVVCTQSPAHLSVQSRLCVSTLWHRQFVSLRMPTFCSLPISLILEAQPWGPHAAIPLPLCCNLCCTPHTFTPPTPPHTPTHPPTHKTQLP